jgi:hypothetical protein
MVFAVAFCGVRLAGGIFDFWLGFCFFIFNIGMIVELLF